ncbi:outer membrane beta-barrel family protein, partial [Phenylobacterium sp.]|uniref:outer membrane beta-barrel family protein n=1 Tax=Phenylobacterium sp. TaxID=1871053 RepID=UPI0012239DC4
MAGLANWRVGLAAASCALLSASGAMAQSASPPPGDNWSVAPAPVAKPPAAPVKPADKAKAAPPAKPPANGHTVDTITVTGAAPQEVETSIDKKTYTLGKDLTATTGSIADALKNLPSVDVDVQGTLSLRGDSNVTILVDGKPSPQFDGKDRADALQQLPADQIERVEVITNPSAALNPEGTGGVINLITKKSRGAGVTGSAYVTAASAGLKRAGANFGYNSSKLAITGSLAGNYQHNKQHFIQDLGALDPVSGQFLKTQHEEVGRNLARGPTARLSVTYTPEDKDQITGSASYNTLLVQGHPFDHYVDDDASGAPASILSRQGERRFLEIDSSISAGWKHTFGAGHDLSLDAIYNTSVYRDRDLYATTEILPLAVVPLQGVRQDENDHHSEFRIAYDRPLAGGALKAGYELKHDDNDTDDSGTTGAIASALVPDPSLANHFLYAQTVNAAYATYEHTFGSLGLQAGLRVEDVQLEIDQLTSGERARQDYVKAYPTLHLSYKLDDDRKVTASFSERVQRPPSFLLNPLIYFNDPQDAQKGNPNLRPQDTQSYELGYELRQGQSNYGATLYYRRYENQITQVEQGLSPGVLEYTYGNLGSSQAAGVELTATGKLTSTLSYNASSNIYYSQIDAANLMVGAGAESGYGISGRFNLNWQVRPDDMLQFNATANGKRLVAEGELEPVYTVNLGWRHKVNDRLSATVTVQDALATNRFARRLSTPTFSEDLTIRPAFRQVFFRLDYRFGGSSAKAAKEPG